MEEYSLNTRIIDLTPRTPYNTPTSPFRPQSGSQSPVELVDESSEYPSRHGYTNIQRSGEPLNISQIRDLFARNVGSNGIARYVILDTQSVEDAVVPRDFIEQCNDPLAGRELEIKAVMTLKRMLHMAGLTIDRPSTIPLNIPKAYLGLCRLSELNDPVLKVQALDALIILLKKDPLTLDSSTNLVQLTMDLMKTLDKHEIQKQRVDIQEKIAEAYNLAIELMIRHYRVIHINAIEEGFKTQLLHTAQSLKRMNRQDDPKLAFHAQAALEGIRRLQDDSQELLNFFRRAADFIAGTANIALRHDVIKGLSALKESFRDLDPHITNPWYNAMLIFKDIGKKAVSDVHSLHVIEGLLYREYPRYSWKYTYAAMDVLTDLIINGATRNIREQAFHGWDQHGAHLPGLGSFAGCNALETHLDYNQMWQGKIPHTKDTNLRVRGACIDHLKRISAEAPDAHIREGARHLLAQRFILERDYGLYTKLAEIVPRDPALRNEWIEGLLSM